MKIPTLLLSLLISSILLPTVIFGQRSDTESAKSVVKITTRFPGTDPKTGKTGTKVGNATGWCWNNSRQVVTALHAVAGIPDANITVYTDMESKSSGAKVVKVLKEADLALLELSSDLGLIPLILADVDPNSKNEYYIWGFPHGIFQMAGDDIRFSRSLGTPPTLNSLINKTDFKFTLEQQKYPWPKSQILRVSSTIQPGHSGAPILVSTGQVIGVADGGLREGSARLNWAFPASLYVPKLLNSNDPIPTTVSLQNNLYSSYTIVPDGVSQEEQNQIIEAEVKEHTVGNDEHSITKTWTANYDEIIETMSEEDKNSILGITQQYGLDMHDTWFDVYEDFTTGATVTIPASENMVYKDSWFYVDNEYSTLQYGALIFDAGTYENAISGVEETFRHLLNTTVWVESADLWIADPDDEDEIEEYPEDEYASVFMSRYSNDGQNLMLMYNAEVQGSGMLVVYLFCDLDYMTQADYMKQFLHYAVALNLATFAEY